MTQTDHYTLTRYTYEGLSLLTRDSEWDRGISREVWHEYWWDRVRRREVKTALDIGAHIGAWTLTLKHFHPRAQVVAVELMPENAHILSQNLSDVDGAMPLHRRVGYSGDDLVVAAPQDNTGGGYAVDTREADRLRQKGWRIGAAVPRITIEDILREYRLDHIDIMKLDAEGAEYDILAHIQPDTLAKIGVIVGEHHGPMWLFDERVGKRLREHGFTIDYKPSQIETLGMFWAERA
jgi:FkbM family methyltransferase